MEKEHLDMISNAFECLKKASLKNKLSKCSFFKEQIHYLGHLVIGTSILPLANKIEALMELKPPTTNTSSVLQDIIENSYAIMQI